MKNIYIGRCQICQEYGMLEIVVETNSQHYSVMCDECSTEWGTPEEAFNNINGFRGGVRRKVRNATIQEIKKRKWDKYIIKN